MEQKQAVDELMSKGFNADRRRVLCSQQLGIRHEDSK